MKLKSASAAGRAGLLVIMASGIFLAGCTVVRTGSNLALPVVTVAPTSASVTTGATVQFTATVVSPQSTTISWYVNGILGGNATIGTVNASGLYTAPASVPNPATVSIQAISSAETNPTGTAVVTISSSSGTPTVSLLPGNSAVPSGMSVQFTAAVTGSTNTGVNWSVNGVAGGSSALGSISASGLYSAPTTVPAPATVVVTATSQADASQAASTTLTITSSNTAPLFVNLGPNGNGGTANTNFYNELLTSVTVCLPGTQNCQVIPNILVDTSSVGLRVLNSALTTVPATELQSIRDSHQNQIQECVQFGDTSYAWGPAMIADVVIAGETASSVPMQVIGGSTFTVPTSSCLSLGPGPSLDTVAALGANGILGVGTSVQDCGPNCAAGQTFPAYPYYICPNQVCQTAVVPVDHQVANPVAFFTGDNNGVEIQLPAIPSAGAASIPYVNSDGTGLIPAGLLIFGVGTQSNNALGNATLYAVDENGNFPNMIYGGTSYPSGGILDSSSNALYILNPQILGVLDCTDNRYYCPNPTLPVSLTFYGANGNTGTAALTIANADTLLGDNPGFAAFSELGGPSGKGF